jgi:hypothetical protein
MENDGGTATTAAVEGQGRKGDSATVHSSSESLLLSEKEINEKLRKHLSSLGDIVYSPQEQLILRNIILTLLELPEHQFKLEKACDLASEDQAQARAVELLKQETPQYWSSDWNLLWKKDADPLLSFSQQRATSRARLVTFWESEWNTIPIDVRNHVAIALKAMMKR